jgi:tetratricopeptide (TPR) repeat protein
MIYELKPGEYEIARPIFKGLQYNLAIFSVIEGNTPGSVYVDDVADPKIAFVWEKSRDSGFYLEGYERNAGFNAFDNCLVHGGYDLGRKKFRQSAEWYERAFEMADAGEEAALESHWFSDAGDKAGCYYNAARAWALAGESEAAIRNLNRAIDSGWTDAEHLRTDEDLERLRGTQSWEDLMERLA